MISKEHHKHSKIAKAGYGFFNRNEWAITGTTCSNTKILAGKIIEGLSLLYKCGYADADHDKNEYHELQGTLKNSAFAEYIDRSGFQQFNYNTSFNQFHLKQLFAQADMVLINGNHFEGKAQVIVIDETKKESLHKKIEHCTNLQLILLANDTTGVFDFVKDAIPGWDQIPTYKLHDTQSIIDFFRKKMNDAKPVLNGLVLAGGKSMRMGFDKSAIEWHGRPQKYYMADMLKTLCHEVYISSNDDKVETGNYKIIKDSFTDLGPFGAILSAFREHPDKAWFIVACDLPLLDIHTLNFLKDNRNTSSLATAFQGTYTNLPEPLITIWEPKSYPVLLNFLSQGISCPRKVLINNYNVSILNPPEPSALKNVNTPDDMEEVKAMIHQKMTHQNAS